MSNGDNGPETQRGFFPSNSSKETASKLEFDTYADSLAARARVVRNLYRADAARLQAARDTGAQQERHRLARELHDSVSPALFSIGLLASAALADVTADQDKVRRALKLVLEVSQKQLDEMRQLMMYMHAASLVEALAETVAFARDYAGVQAEAELCCEPTVDDGVKVALYKIAREAVYNAAKHARCRRLLVRLERQDGHLVLDVTDDGLGFDLAAVPAGHYGVASMRERAAILGGTIEINSAPGAGTRVRVAVPAA